MRQANPKHAKTLFEMADTLKEMSGELNDKNLDKNSYLQMRLLQLAAMMRARGLFYLHPPESPKPDATGATQEELPF